MLCSKSPRGKRPESMFIFITFVYTYTLLKLRGLCLIKLPSVATFNFMCYPNRNQGIWSSMKRKKVSGFSYSTNNMANFEAFLQGHFILHEPLKFLMSAHFVLINRFVPNYK